LFDLYLDRLEPQSAEVFSAWVLNSWIDHEFSRNDRFSANAYVNKYAPTLIEQYRLWYPDKPANEAMASLSTELLQRYQRSGATSKGLLALAFKAPPALVAKLLRSCLKSRRSSTSSTRALLELAAASAHPTTLQVIISAAKRARPMSLRKLAGELINGIAEQRGWSLDELGDRTVPDADFEPDGSLLLPCGKDRKQYFGRLDNKSKLIIFNPAGKKVASLPAGADTFTNASRQRLTNSREELAQVVEQQTVRLYEALCTEREWPVENWLRDLIGHSLMQKLAQRIIWLGFDAQGAVQASFRPTAEGDYTDAEDYLVELSDFAAIRLAHTTLLDEASNAAWIAHLAEYKIEPLLDQFERPAFLLEDSEKARAVTEIKDRKGWLMDSSTLRAEVKKLGYERTPNLVGSSFLDYRKSFGHTGWCAVINFTGFFAPRQNDKAALLDMHFEQDRWLITLGDVPAVLLSECWNDLHQIASIMIPTGESKPGGPVELKPA